MNIRFLSLLGFFLTFAINLMSIELLTIKTALRDTQADALIIISGTITNPVSETTFTIQDGTGSIDAHIPFFLWSAIGSTSPVLDKTIKLVGLVNKDNPNKTIFEAIAIIEVKNDYNRDAYAPKNNPVENKPTTSDTDPNGKKIDPIASNSENSSSNQSNTTNQNSNQTASKEESPDYFNPYTNKKFRDPVPD